MKIKVLLKIKVDKVERLLRIQLVRFTIELNTKYCKHI